MESLSLNTLADEHLAIARDHASGRSAKTLYGGHEHTMRQTLIALAAGHSLGEHDSPIEATLQVVRGNVRLRTETASWDGTVGDLLGIPPERHSLEALSDAVVLLTVLSDNPHEG